MFPITPTSSSAQVAVEASRLAAAYQAAADHVAKRKGRGYAWINVASGLRRNAAVCQGVASIAAGKEVLGEHRIGGDAGRLTAALLLA
jgi:hypothetical protein